MPLQIFAISEYTQHDVDSLMKIFELDRKVLNNIIEARKKADEDLAKARTEIATEKAAAMAEIKNLVAELSISVTEKVLRSKLDNPAAQNQLVNHYLTDLKVGSN